MQHLTYVLLPYNNTGKQYVLTRCTASISSFAVPRTDMMLLKLPKKFLRAMDGSVELVLLLIDTLRYLTFFSYGDCHSIQYYGEVRWWDATSQKAEKCLAQSCSSRRSPSVGHGGSVGCFPFHDECRPAWCMESVVEGVGGNAFDGCRQSYYL